MSTTEHRMLLLALDQPLDRGLVQRRWAAASAEVDVVGDVRWFDDASALLDAVAAARSSADVVLLLDGGADLGTALAAPDGADGLVVRVDPVVREPDDSPGLLCHIAGRGLDGIVWAVRACVNRRRVPVTDVAYGQHPEQFAQLRLPAPTGAAPAVAVLLHGGFWRSRWQLDLMDAMAIDLAGRGMASWNVEYRRPDRHGWAATTADVRAAVCHLEHLAATGQVDADRVAVVGHSAGAQLAVRVVADLWADAARVRPQLIVPLAGVLDLVESYRRDLGEGAVAAALGGGPDALADVYRASSPVELAPVGPASLTVIARDDSTDLNEMSLRYVAAVRSAGGRADLVEGPGDHFAVIDPRAAVWQQAATRIFAELAGSPT